VVKFQKFDFLAEGAVKPTRTRIGLLVRRESMRSPRGAPQKRWRK